MKAVYFEAYQAPISVETLPDPTLKKNGVIIQVKATGICRSDWHGWMGHDSDVRLPHVPGHELAGNARTTLRFSQRRSSINGKESI